MIRAARPWRRVLVITLAAAFGPPNASAQSVATPARNAAGTVSRDDVQRLRREVNRNSIIRVEGEFGIVELTRPSLEADGLHYAGAFFTKGSGSSRPPSVIPMDQIRAIAGGRRSRDMGMAMGTLAGMLAGIALAREGGAGGPFAGVGYVAALASMAVGGAGGAIVGSSIRRWEPIYPTPEVDSLAIRSRRPLMRSRAPRP